MKTACGQTQTCAMLVHFCTLYKERVNMNFKVFHTFKDGT